MVGAVLSNGTLIYTVLLIFVTGNISAQVINDDIAGRLELKTDGTPLISSTSDCTVQWACVDQSLTGKCIQYHNDQWFFFNSEDKNRLYINIANQRCKDDRGVQIVVLTGRVCEPSTYSIIACVSPADQDDVFIRLDSLATNEIYLINIDGYLHDFCRFEIAVSEKPKGIPIKPTYNEVDFRLHQEENRVEITWTFPIKNNNDFVLYEIYRRKSGQHKSTLIGTVDHEKNAYGISRQDYFYHDTLKENGTYHYKVIASRGQENREMLGERQVIIENIYAPKDQIRILLDYKDMTPLRVLLLDRLSQKILLRQDFSFDKKNNSFELAVGSFLELGVTTFEVVIVNLKTSERNVYFFDF